MKFMSREPNRGGNGFGLVDGSGFKAPKNRFGWALSRDFGIKSEFLFL